MQSSTPPNPTLPCPNAGTLQSFNQGTLPAERIEWIGHHLAECGDCEMAVSRLDDDSDSVVAQLREIWPEVEDQRQLEGVRQELAAMDVEITDSFVTGHLEDDLPPGDDHWALLQVPKVIGQYEILEEIGHGGMGIVFRARHVSLDRQVALKLLAPRRAMTPDSVDRFRREMVAMGRFDHPNIIRATDAGDADGHHFLVMEYAQGIDVSSLVARLGPLPVADACELVRQAALGLDFARQHGVVHRDVKPSNLLLTPAGQVKILDMGLASFQSSQMGEKRQHTVFGTADYMAPEQWRDQTSIDCRADIYSLGCTLFKLLTGSAPFAAVGRDVHAKRRAHLQDSPPSLRRVRPEVSVGLENVLLSLMAKQPENRPPTPGVVAHQIVKFAGGHQLAQLYARADRSHSDTLTDAADRTAVEEQQAVPRRRAPLKPVILMVSVAIILGGLIVALLASFGSDLNRNDPVPIGGWQDLLSRSAPTVKGYDLLTPVEFDPDTQRLRLESTDRVFAELESIDNPGIAFRVRVSPEVDGEAGVYFGGRGPSFGQRPRESICQTLTIARRSNRSVLQRGYLHLRDDETGTTIHRADNYAFCEAELTGQYNGEELAMHVEIDGSIRIVWNGREVFADDWTVMPGRVPDLDYRGSFGVLNCKGATVFDRPQWKRF